MSNYVSVYKNEEYNGVTVSFQNEMEKPLALGEKMYAINASAYMNGYNWDAFFNYYLAENHPDLLEGLEPDPEAGSYVGRYELTPENEKKAEAFKDVISELIEDEEKVLRIVREKGGEIEWD